MIFVNYGGGGYWFFGHSKWNGLTFADLVFPWFIWIMGTAMALSFNSLESRRARKVEILAKVIRRSIILFGLGLFLNNGWDLDHWRIPGVLQRFGISYFFVSMIIMFVPKYPTHKIRIKNIHDNASFKAVGGVLADISPYWLQWAVAGLLLTVWFLVTFLVNVPGCGRGYLGPGGIGDGGKYFNCTGGAARIIDEWILGPNHFYHSPTCRFLYDCPAYDPEGILGSLTSIFLCFLGLQSGRILVHYKEHLPRIKRWIIWGVFWGTLATILCFGRQEGGPVPINKNLWSASFISVMAGTGFLALALIYFIVDVKKFWNGVPFIFVGMNSILVYVGHETLGDRFPFHWDATQTHGALLWENGFGVACWIIIAYRMYQLKFFVNI